MKLKIYSQDGTSSKEKEFNNFRAFDDEKGIAALHQVVKAYQANLRQGNASSKDRGEVAGSGKKPYRQKGTGMARHGEKRSPIWCKGGVVFGPKPRDYSQKINKSMKRLAFQRALFDSAQEGSLNLIEAFHANEIKTQSFSEILKNIRSEGKMLIVDLNFQDNVILSARNIGRVHMMEAQSINALDLVKYPYVLMSEAAFEHIINRSNI